jgi:anti-sigma B factor antagonist
VDGLDVVTSTTQGAVLVVVSGDVDLHTAPSLRAALDQAVGQAGEGAGAVVADLSQVGFLDSTGLGELVAAHQALAASDGRLLLVVAHERVRRLLRITGLADVLAVHADLDSALAAVAAQ